MLRMAWMICCSLSVLAFAGCETETLPTPDDRIQVDPTPTTDEFLLADFEVNTPNESVWLQLVGKNVRTDLDNELVSIDVAILNPSRSFLGPNITVWLDQFRPTGVVPFNPDIIPPGLPPFGGPYGYDYTGLLGEDDILSGGETSESKTWIFSSPGAEGFSFSSYGDATPGTGLGRIRGTVFWDDNANGEQDPGESGFDGYVEATHGSGIVARAEVGTDGYYTLSVNEPGLYTLAYYPPPTLATFAPLGYTTPNPLQVILPPDANGLPASFDDANFGVTTVFDFLECTDLAPGDIDSDPYYLDGAEVVGQLLRVKVGYSGCEPGHPFKLYMAGSFAESNPVQASLVLAHDDRDELCDAAFEETRLFSLHTLIAKYAEAYGSPHGTILLRLDGHNGLIEFNF